MKLTERWRLQIQHGPDGQGEYAWVFSGKELVGVMRTDHAAHVVEAVNAYAVITGRAALQEGKE